MLVPPAASSSNNPRVLLKKYRRVVRSVVEALEGSENGLKRWIEMTERDKIKLCGFFTQSCDNYSLEFPPKKHIRENIANAIRNRILYKKKKL